MVCTLLAPSQCSQKSIEPFVALANKTKSSPPDCETVNDTFLSVNTSLQHQKKDNAVQSNRALGNTEGHIDQDTRSNTNLSEKDVKKRVSKEEATNFSESKKTHHELSTESINCEIKRNESIHGNGSLTQIKTANASQGKSDTAIGNGRNSNQKKKSVNFEGVGDVNSKKIINKSESSSSNPKYIASKGRLDIPGNTGLNSPDTCLDNFSEKTKLGAKGSITIRDFNSSSSLKALDSKRIVGALGKNETTSINGEMESKDVPSQGEAGTNCNNPFNCNGLVSLISDDSSNFMPDYIISFPLPSTNLTKSESATIKRIGIHHLNAITKSSNHHNLLVNEPLKILENGVMNGENISDVKNLQDAYDCEAVEESSNTLDQEVTRIQKKNDSANIFQQMKNLKQLSIVYLCKEKIGRIERVLKMSETTAEKVDEIMSLLDSTLKNKWIKPGDYYDNFFGPTNNYTVGDSSLCYLMKNLSASWIRCDETLRSLENYKPEEIDYVKKQIVSNTAESAMMKSVSPQYVTLEKLDSCRKGMLKLSNSLPSYTSLHKPFELDLANEDLDQPVSFFFNFINRPLF